MENGSEALDKSQARFEIGSVVSGFEVLDIDPVPEMDAVAYLMKHGQTGARLLYIDSPDDNKTFSIAFKTPPANDTGVFHILEHSVLCGSENYPVKEPFVDLLKSSMQTFLNAMTYPDKTVYPVSSTNDKDLLNLASIYIDAVLNPAIYAKPQIFEQEGWHYEVADDDARTLSTNGVVYSEMKGALSDPDSVLEDALMRELFPDAPYGFESGGDPKRIPELTYEEFLDTHSRHYRLDNSYTLLYGNLDPERFLAFLDERYSEAKVRSTEPPNALPLQNPVKSVGVRCEMATAKDNACIAQGYVAGSSRERERLAAAQVALSYLMGSNEAPLKRAILDSGIAGSVSSTLFMELQQPFVLLQVNTPKVDDAEERFRQIVVDVCSKVADEGVDAELMLASISNIEFACREGNLNGDDGVEYAVSTLVSWLYDDSMATTHLHYAELFENMRQNVRKGFFEKLIREVFVENPHMASVELVPVEADSTAWETSKMTELRAGMSADELDAIEARTAGLREMQELPDSPEARATVPRLALADVGEVPTFPAYGMVEDLQCIKHDVDTHGIVYASRFFDLGCVTIEDYPYVWLLARMLGKVATERHSASDLATLMKAKLGNLSFAMRVYENIDDVAHPRAFLEANGSALSDNVESLVEIAREVICESVLADPERIRNVLEQDKAYTEQMLVNAAHMLSGTRMGSMFRPAQVLQDKLIGVEHYRFLKQVLADFDEHSGEVVAKLQQLAETVFCDDGAVFSFAGAQGDFDRFFECGPQLGRKRAGGGAEAAGTQAAGAEAAGSQAPHRLQVQTLLLANEAFVIPSNVAYVTAGNDCLPMGAPYGGFSGVAANAMSLDYLWTEVRVKGGAYGAGGRIPRSRLARFYSYRDPHIDETLRTFRNAGQWMCSYEPEGQALDGYKISTVATGDAPQKPRALVSEQNARFFAGISEEERIAYRREALDTTLDVLHQYGRVLDEAMEQSVACVFASREMIERSGTDFEVVDLFAE